jgi:hypothetical protein
MSRLIITLSAIAMLAAFSMACGAPAPTIVSNSSPGGASNNSPTAAPARAGSAGDLRFQAPAQWKSEPPSSSMRVAQYLLPRAEGDAEDAALVVYYFGQGQGGSVEANLDRWVNQMQQPDGRPSKERAKTETMTVNGLNVTLLDVTGTYLGSDMGGGGPQQSKSSSRMRAAVIETPKGAYFIKLVGPEKTVSRWDQEFMAFVKSAEFK